MRTRLVVQVHVFSATGYGFCCVCYNWGRILRVTLIHVQCDCISTRVVVGNWKTRRSVLRLSVVVLEFDAVEGR